MALPNIPRTMVETGLRSLRIPVAVAGRFTDTTPYESFEAGARIFLGSLLRDGELVTRGELQRAKVEETLEARRLHEQAEQQRLQAEKRMDERLQDAEQLRTEAERKAEQNRLKVEQEKAAEKRRVEEAARKEEQRARDEQERREKVVVAEERRARRTRAVAETTALSAETRAIDATVEARDLERAIEKKKQARKQA